MHRIEVALKAHLPDPAGLGLVKDIHDIGIASVSDARVIDVYWLNGSLTKAQMGRIGEELLADPVTQDFWYENYPRPEEQPDSPFHSIEVTYNAGVTDPVQASILKAINDLGIKDVKAVKTARRYLIKGKLTNAQLESIGGKLLVNSVVQHVVKQEEAFPETPRYKFTLKEVEIKEAGKQLGFSADELKAIRDYYKKQGRNPTDVELETLAQTWSEHCVHKTFKAQIKCGDKVVNSLIKSTIMKVTKELNKPWCLSVFMDNAGVIDFDGRQAVCFKVETHNHPSAIEPYGGAATGLGGVIRDPLGTGLGAKPILNTDVFCFAPPDFPHDRLPQGVLHPRRVFKGVRAGVADYGNRMGIPTLNGAILFDERYLANPLVFCGTLGIMPKEMAPRGQQQPGDLVVLVGGRTGRDGIHGVTFASEQLTDESSTASLSAVQIGNAIVEKKFLDVLLQARDKGLYVRITDVGGGGLSSAVGEMGESTGVRVDLEKVPLKYAGLSYTEIWISESQERMIIAVPPEHVKEFLELFAAEDVDAVVIGEFTDNKRLQLFYNNNRVCDLDMEFLHKGIPQVKREAVWSQAKNPEPEFPCPADLGKPLTDILGAWNVCSKEWVIRQYDHEVQGASVLKSMVGKNLDGPGDAAIVKPVFDSNMGLIVANGINPYYADIDPYWMAASVIDEALRQIIAVGGNLEKVALLDNFCWGNVQQPEILGALVRATEACYDIAKAYGTPFVSGKDSLYNEFEYKGKIISIPHTLLISAVGVMEDISKAVSMDFKQPGNLIYAVGATYNEMGGSHYLKQSGFTGNSVPRVNAAQAKALMDRLSRATSQGLVRACHDCSEGGIGVALAEMAFAGGLGAELQLKSVPLGEKIEREDFILFSESNSRFICEVEPKNQKKFEDIMKSTSFAVVGKVTDSDRLEIYGLKGKKVVDQRLGELKEAWQKPLRW